MAAATYSFASCGTEKRLLSCDTATAYHVVAKKFKTMPALFLVWADWCGHCKESMPYWMEFQNAFLSDKHVANRPVVFDIEAQKHALLMSPSSPPNLRKSATNINSFPQVYYMPKGACRRRWRSGPEGSGALLRFLKTKIGSTSAKGERRCQRLPSQERRQICGKNEERRHNADCTCKTYDEECVNLTRATHDTQLPPLHITTPCLHGHPCAFL